MRRPSTPFALFLITLFLTASLTAVAQQPAPAANPVAALGLNANLPTDPAITIGRLPNGLKYYIRSNKQPKDRAELRLVVNTGSILETDEQQGLAHFVEHMAFNGTEHFPGDGVVKFLQSLGMRFGADLNASTSFDETIYMLTAPTDKPDVLDKAFMVLEDWAHNVSFNTAEIDKERGVIMEEWRLRRGAGARIQDKELPIILKGSRYADRIPIGKTEIIQNFKPEVLKKFYTDWYRPDLMAVIAVGDFDKAAIEGLIKSHFSSIPAATNKPPRTAYDVPDHPGSIYAILTDKETTNTVVSIDNLVPARKQGTVGVYRQDIVASLFSSMLSTRYAEIAQKSDAPFLQAFAERAGFIGRNKEDASLGALAKENNIEAAVDTLVSEAERVAQFGFTATELDRQKQSLLRSLERMVAQKENRESGSHASEYIRNFLENEPMPGADIEYALHQRFLPEITLDEVNKLAKDWLNDQNRLVIINAPEKAGVTIPDEAKLAAAIKTASSKTMTAYVDKAASQSLMEALPQAGSIAKTNTREPGITEWELSNGVKVVLKPTSFKADEILFRAFSPGGTSLAGDADFIPASTAVQVVTAGGLGKFSAIDLRKVLTGKVASARPFIGETDEGVTGGSSKRDLETMFQLIYLTFTAPRPDEEAFAVQAGQTRTLLANQSASPDYAFAKTLTDTLYQNHLRRRLTTPETVAQWNLEKSLAFYKSRFADASDFTFVFVGDFDVNAIKPLAERYLASLPAIRRQETWKDVGVRPPKGVIEKTVEKGVEPKSQVAIVFSGPMQYDPEHRIALGAAANVLQDRLRETIREELGGTYSITVSPSTQKNPNPEFSLVVQFTCDPARTADLTKRVFQEIARFRNEGPTPRQTTDVKETLSRTFETSSQQNQYLLTVITSKYQYGEDVAEVWQVPQIYQKLDSASIQQAAKTYLDLDNHVQVTLMPEKK